MTFQINYDVSLSKFLGFNDFHKISNKRWDTHVAKSLITSNHPLPRLVSFALIGIVALNGNV